VKEVEGSGFKLWYTGAASGRNGVGILIDRSFKDGVVDVKRQGDWIILVRLVVGDMTLNVISAYAPQVGLSESVKRQFWEDLDSMVSTVPIREKLFIGRDSMAMWVRRMLVTSECMGGLGMVAGTKREKMC
jgi:exonuclease III